MPSACETNEKVFSIFLFFLIACGVWIPISGLLAGYLVVEKPLEEADAIFVLSGSEDYLERTQAAAKLFKEKTARKIFLTNDGLKGGWDQKEQRNPFFAERARWNLIEHGVPAEAIEILPTIVEGTIEEAHLLVEVSAERNIKSIVLVTSAYHSRRALRTFERAALSNNSQLQIGMKIPANKEAIPSFGWEFSIKGWKTVAGEYLKMIYYRLMY